MAGKNRHFRDLSQQVLSGVVAKNTDDKNGKNRKNNKCHKIQNLEREEAKKGLEISANVAKIAKVTRIFLARKKNTDDKYRKNNRCNKIQNLEREEATTPKQLTGIAVLKKSASLQGLRRCVFLLRKQPMKLSIGRLMLHAHEKNMQNEFLSQSTGLLLRTLGRHLSMLDISYARTLHKLNQKLMSF